MVQSLVHVSGKRRAREYCCLRDRGYSKELSVRVCRPALQILSLLQTKTQGSRRRFRKNKSTWLATHYLFW